jgi:glycosyltransferase involved in cell wall biosynthesis
MKLDISVSVVIPAYNAARYVGGAIESARSQSIPPLEIIVVDDGSKDDTAEVVDRYPPPVRLIRQANRGPSAARNRGCFEARGAWLALLDADDKWFPSKLERQLTLAHDPRVGLIHSCYPGTDTPDKMTFDDLWKRNWICTSSVLVRRTAFCQVGGFDEDLTFAEDYNLWLRLVALGWQVALCRERLFLYDPQPDGLSTKREQMAKDELRNVEKIGRMLDMPAREIHERQLLVCKEYARDMVNHRELAAARRLLLTHPSIRTFGWLLATFTPVSVLDWRRRVVHGNS